MNLIQNQLQSIFERLNILEAPRPPVEWENIVIDQEEVDRQMAADRQVLDEVKEEVKEEPDCCPICLDTLKEVGVVTLECGHKMDLQCFLSFQNTQTGRRCPMCRRNIRNEPEPAPRRIRNRFQEILDDFLIEDSDSEDDEPILPINDFIPRRLLNINRPDRPARQPAPFRQNQTQRRIMEVMSNHYITTSIVQSRIQRNHQRFYVNGTLTSNFAILCREGLLTRRRNQWRRR